MTAPALAQPNVFTPVQLKTAEATSVEIVGQETIIVSPDIVWLSNFYWKRVYNAHFCSGVVLWSQGHHALVATARHCTLKEFIPDLSVDKPDPHDNWAVIFLSPQKVYFQNGNQGTVNSFMESTNSDVTILDVTTVQAVAAAKLSPTPVYRGEPLLAYSMPQGFHYTALQAISAQGTEPLLKQLEKDDKDAWDFVNHYHWEGAETYVCAGCAGGVSGGPMYDENGYVVGLSVGVVGTLGTLMPAPYVSTAMKVFGANPKLRGKVFTPDKYDTCLLDTPYICEEYGVSDVREGELPADPANSADYSKYKLLWNKALFQAEGHLNI